MNLNLKKDLCFFDLEATGLNVVRDRIIQIAVVKFFKDGRQPAKFEMLINPGIPISEEAISVHGITANDVARKPAFPQVARQIYDFIGDADLAGYNISRFDVPLLMEEFERADLQFDIEPRHLVDVQRIFYKMEPRNLRAALRFYCGREMEDAHNALADVKATIDVFNGQLEKYNNVDHIDDDGNVTPTPIRNDVETLHNFTQDERVIDVTNRLKYNDKNEIAFNFGKYMGKTFEQVFEEDRNYFYWILNKDFAIQVKNTVRKYLQEKEKPKQASNGKNPDA